MGNLCDLGLGKEYLDLKPKTWPIKGKIEKLDFIKIKKLFLRQGLTTSSKIKKKKKKNFCSAKNPVKRTKREVKE
jgi:hypothetical protein